MERIKREYSGVTITDNNKEVISSNIIFLAVHPPAIEKVAEEIKTSLTQDKILISLAPKVTIAKLLKMLNGFNRIVRMISNAPSIINRGYNPVHFSTSITQKEKIELLSILDILEESHEIEEEKLEEYAILTAMGPIYLWFQLFELHDIAKSFGLRDEEIEEGIIKMVYSAVKTIYKSGISPFFCNGFGSC